MGHLRNRIIRNHDQIMEIIIDDIKALITADELQNRQTEED